MKSAKASAACMLLCVLCGCAAQSANPSFSVRSLKAPLHQYHLATSSSPDRGNAKEKALRKAREGRKEPIKDAFVEIQDDHQGSFQATAYVLF